MALLAGVMAVFTKVKTALMMAVRELNLALLVREPLK
jgi:hypothetical protein